MKKILILSVLSIVATSLKAQNLISNPSFENNAPFYFGAGSPEFQTFSPTGAAIANWVVDSNTVDLHNKVHGCTLGSMGCPPGGGDHHIDLNSNGGIHQGGIRLIAGRTYVLSFWRSKHCGIGSVNARAQVSVGPAGATSFLSASFTGAAYTWTESRYVFVAPSTATVDIAFAGKTAVQAVGGVLIDSVVLRDSTASGSAGEGGAGRNTSCSDTCYWKVEGNSILAPGRNIFGTLSNDDVRIFTNNNQCGVLAAAGNFGWNTLVPTAKFHINVTGQSATGGIRFEGLPTAKDTNVLSIDPRGNVHVMSLPASGVTSTCTTQHFIPKVAGSGSSNLTCSQVFDNGVSVGIGTSGPFGYTSGASLTSGLPAAPSSFKLSVNGWTSSTAFVALSDKRMKRNVRPLQNALEKISKLNGVTYNWDNSFDPSIETNGAQQIGFLAQDVQKVIPEATVVNERGIYGISYDMIIPVLTEAIKEQQAQIEELKKLVMQGSTKINAEDKSHSDATVWLEQNTPNPFSDHTEIRYRLPAAAEKAIIGIFDLNGQQRKAYPVHADNAGGVLTVYTQELQPGMYLYSLIVDGKALETKRMVVLAP
ncbi:tail fiber domain-containing protein [Rurimicrobium arvi]|uniref:Peptidase S74 domain-containing protein n=1 Tax=Rurimicrobium arvi TaxID=2049916 RepID=A0ABP8MI13_9BACT